MTPLPIAIVLPQSAETAPRTLSPTALLALTRILHRIKQRKETRHETQPTKAA